MLKKKAKETLCMNYPTARLSARNPKCTNWRCTFGCSVYSRVLVLLSFAQMTPVRCCVSVEFIHCAPDGSSRRISTKLVRAGAGCMREREKKGKARETETGVWLTLLPIRRWPLWSEPFPWETSLLASRSNWMPFLFCRAPFSPHRHGALKYKVLTLTKKEALCLYLMLIEFGTFYIAVMLKLFLLFLVFGPVLLNEGGWLIKVARSETGPRLRARVSYTAFHVCVWRAFSIADLWIHFVK